MNPDVLSESASGAVFSSDGVYRYVLWRELPQLEAFAPPGGGTVVFCLLNPSTADATKPDPTLDAMCEFGRRWGKSRVIVVNAFAFKSTHPLELKNVVDPIGPECDAWITWAASVADTCVAGWGNGPQGFGEQMKSRASQVLPLLGEPLFCLFITAKGMPQHPLYIARSTPLRSYPGP